MPSKADDNPVIKQNYDKLILAIIFQAALDCQSQYRLMAVDAMQWLVGDGYRWYASAINFDMDGHVIIRRAKAQRGSILAKIQKMSDAEMDDVLEKLAKTPNIASLRDWEDE